MIRPLAFLGISIGIAAAQTGNSPVIRVGTRLVQINVIARDKNGPVADLRKEDFTLLDQGKPRTIAVFRVDSRQADEEKLRTQAKLPANIFTNSLADASNTTVVLFDGLNTPLTDQQYAKAQIVKFLNELHQEDRVAIYTLGRGLRVLHEFTRDVRSLQTAVKRFNGDSNDKTGQGSVYSGSDVNEALSQLGGIALAAGSTAARDLLNTSSNQAISDTVTLNRVRITAEALKAIARHLQAIPGRKNLVWVSGGFPVVVGFDTYGSLAADQADEAARALMEANVAVYPVDARGLMTNPKFSGAAGNPMPGGRPSQSRIQSPIGVDEQTTMDRIALPTGGKSFYNTNDIAGAVRRAVDDSSVSYTLGFYLQPDELDSKFHAIKVTVARKGVEARTRKGYLGFQDEPVSAMAATKRDELIREAVNAPLDETGLTLSFRLDRVAEPSKPEAFAILAGIEGKKLLFEQKDGKYLCTTQVIVAQQAPDGSILDVMDQTVNWSLLPARYKEVLARGLQFKRLIEAKQGAAFVTLVVLDHGSGQLGSVRGQAAARK